MVNQGIKKTVDVVSWIVTDQNVKALAGIALNFHSFRNVLTDMGITETRCGISLYDIQLDEAELNALIRKLQ